MRRTTIRTRDTKPRSFRPLSPRHGGTETTCRSCGLGGLPQLGTRASVGVYGRSNGRTAYAGYFEGRVTVTGDFRVFGAKSAVVLHPDGSHRQLYSLGSPESWFEDFGEARLEGGKATIWLDPDFAALIDTSRYYVFLTSYDPVHLHVQNRVHVAPGLGDSMQPTTFSDHVVGKRKDIAGTRLATVEVQAVSEDLEPTVG
jgi:hypothetical protein